MSKLSDAFAELCGICRPRPDQDEAGLEATARGLWKVLGEYPEPVALAALDLWPRRSEWFPTGKELRDLLNQVSAEARISAEERGHVGGGRFHSPVGKTFTFAERVRDVRGDGYVKSWLRGGVTCQFANAKVYTTRIGEERLSKDVGAIAEQCGVEIIHDPDVSKMLSDYCDRHELKFDEPRRRR